MEINGKSLISDVRNSLNIFNIKPPSYIVDNAYSVFVLFVIAPCRCYGVKLHLNHRFGLFQVALQPYT